MIKRGLILLAMVLPGFPVTMSGQDLIFRKDGDIIKARILSKNSLSRSYRLFEHPDSINYFLATSLIDSIHYQNGAKEIFDKIPASSTIETPEVVTDIKHHLLGADVVNFVFHKNLAFSYEFLPGKAHLGYKIGYCHNLDPWPTFEEDNFSAVRNALWYGSVGINYYFFPPGSFRLGTGFRYVLGKTEVKFYEYTNEIPLEWNERRNFSGIMFSLFGYYNVRKNMAFNLGFDTPVAMNLKGSVTVIRGELLLNF